MGHDSPKVFSLSVPPKKTLVSQSFRLYTSLGSVSRPGPDLGTQAVCGKDSEAVDEATRRLACTSRIRRCFVGDGLLTFHSTWYLTHLRDRWHGSVEWYT